MATRDYVTPEYKLSHHGILSLDEFYKAVKNWITLNKYDFYESEYKSLKTIEGDAVRIVWMAERMIDDYRSNRIDVEMDFAHLKQVVKKGSKKRLYECDINVICRGYMNEDYEEQYVSTPLKHFLKALYERFIRKGHLDLVESGLKSDTKKLVDEIKAFFRVM